MSTKRVINAAIAIVFAIILLAMVVYYWRELGCDYRSLAAAVVMYPAIIAALWGVTDSWLKEA